MLNKPKRLQKKPEPRHGSQGSVKAERAGGKIRLYTKVGTAWREFKTSITNKLNQLLDVDLTTTAPTDKQVLSYDSTSKVWKPNTISTLASETLNVDSLSDADTTTDTPSTNQCLKWNGTAWVPGNVTSASEFTYSFESFSDGITSTNVLIGGTSTQQGGSANTGVWKAANTITFTANVNYPPPGLAPTVTLSGAANTWSSAVTLTDPDSDTYYTSSTHEEVKYPPSPSSNIVFTCNDNNGSSTKTQTIYMKECIRYGTLSETTFSSVDIADVESLTEDGVNEDTLSSSFSINCGTGGNKISFAYPSAFANIKQVRYAHTKGDITMGFDDDTATAIQPETRVISDVVNSNGYLAAHDVIQASKTNTEMGLSGTKTFKFYNSTTSEQNAIYWGVSTLDAGADGGGDYTQAYVDGTHADSTLTDYKHVNTITSPTYNIDADADEYAYIAYPSRLGALTSLYVGGIESLGAFWVDSTGIAIINKYGFQETYRVYVSKNPGISNELEPAI